MGEPSVKQIVERCQQGDRKAFGQLYTLMSAYLYQTGEATGCRAPRQSERDTLNSSLFAFGIR